MRPPSARALRLAYFSRSVVSAVAARRELYEREALSVVEQPVSSSPAQFAALEAGEHDLALTSPDNVIAYRSSAANPLGRRLDVRMLLGVDHGLGLSVLARPGIARLADLAGLRVGVDVRQSGFALALFEVLGAAGLEPDRDYEVVTLGSTPQRRVALFEGRCDATLLNAGHDIAAELAGSVRLARITDTLHPYLGTVLAATVPWLEANPDLLSAFGRAWLAATAVVLDPGQRAEVSAVIGEVLDLPPEGAAAAYDVVTGRSDGLVPDGAVDPEALRTVLELRARRGAGSATAPEGLVDVRLLTAAR